MEVKIMSQDKLPETNQTPSLVIVIDKGIVTSIFSNTPLDAIILDYDVVKVTEEEKIIVPFDYAPTDDEIQATLSSIDVIEDQLFVKRVQELY
jgi:hypothetical protein